MKLDPNDPRLTAYALGELDEFERATVEAALRDNPELRREIEAIRRTTDRLATELQAEPCSELTPQQQRAIEESLNELTTTEPSFSWSKLWWTLGFAGATAIVLASLFLHTRKPAREQQQIVALNQTPTPTPGVPGGTLLSGGGSFALSRGSSSVNLISGVVTSSAGPCVLTGSTVNLLGGTLVKNGLGTLVLQNNNTYTGGTVVYGGMLDIGGYVGAPYVAISGGGGTAYSLGRIGSRETYSDGQAWTPLTVGGVSVWDGGGAIVYGGVANVPWQQYPTVQDARRYYPGGESYQAYAEDPFVMVTEQPLSTFGLDVDTASYANIRRFIGERQMPPRDAVRIEEMLNYFKYNYAPPPSGQPFALYVEMAECPWNSAHRLALIGLKAKEIPARKRPASNLVFLIDVSGSMEPVNKLPLIKRAFHLLVGQLDERDRVAIVVYANNARILLRSTNATDKDRILAAIDSLKADGSTNGGEGIQWAYEQARQNFIVGGVNRVILCTDGDFNVGITDQNALVALIQQQAKSGVFLSVLGFGMGNVKDSTMQKLADKGNGHYAYIDDLDEARKVFVEQLQATLVTVAKDAKLQVEFNPAVAQSYRLIGYEKRRLRAQDFNNDRKDAGEVGAGHTVTALYEIVPSAVSGEPGVDPLKYQPQPPPRRGVSDEAMTVKLRYKEPDGDTSKLLTAAVKDTQQRWNKTSDDFRFAAAVAEFGMLLRGSPYRGNATLAGVMELAESARGRDEKGYRREFIALVRQAQKIVDTTSTEDR